MYSVYSESSSNGSSWISKPLLTMLWSPLTIATLRVAGLKPLPLARTWFATILWWWIVAFPCLENLTPLALSGTCLPWNCDPIAPVAVDWSIRKGAKRSWWVWFSNHGYCAIVESFFTAVGNEQIRFSCAKKVFRWPHLGSLIILWFSLMKNLGTMEHAFSKSCENCTSRSPKTSYSLGQGKALQEFNRVQLPAHFLPPLRGGGLVQVLFSRQMEPTQDTEHWPTPCQGDQWPWTVKGENEKVTFHCRVKFWLYILGPENSLHCTAKSLIPIDNLLLDCLLVTRVRIPTMT